ncbi:MAG: malate synthase G, partial [Deltaproteobacteria bacterium]|nr:malate synthase G [Deltaproteobacteria bacterium]
MAHVSVGGLNVSAPLHAFIQTKAAPGTGIDPERFWSALESLVRELAPRNRALLVKRQEMQEKIDDWHRRRRDRKHDAAAYADFLRQIGYLVPQGPAFAITTSGVDPEIATIAGPQLVVPATNARYALNAANARWGSLYDALYGSDVLPEDNGATR